jgi:hypothetical protein
MFDLSTAAAIVDPLTAFATMSRLDRIRTRQQREMAAERQAEQQEKKDA